MSDEKENEVEVELVELETDTPAINTLERFVDWLASEDVECLSSIIIVAETINAAGEPEISWWRDRLSGAWKHDGMLRYAKVAMQQGFIAQYEAEIEAVEVGFEEDTEEDED